MAYNVQLAPRHARGRYFPPRMLESSITLLASAVSHIAVYSGAKESSDVEMTRVGERASLEGSLPGDKVLPHLTFPALCAVRWRSFRGKHGKCFR